MPIDRKTFSMTRPTRWTEDTTGEEYNPDAFIILENKSSRECVFSVMIRKKSDGDSADDLLKFHKDNWLKVVVAPTIIEFKEWGGYRGKGFEIEGRIQGVANQRHRLFAFTKGDSVCVITESARPLDFYTYAADFTTIRESFKLK